jgi:N-acetylmuramoyl-L-alanine amidase
MASSYDFAEHVIKQLKKVTKLHKKKPEGLSLAVLK